MKNVNVKVAFFLRKVVNIVSHAKNLVLNVKALQLVVWNVFKELK